MATAGDVSKAVNGGGAQLAKAGDAVGIKSILSTAAVKKRFEEMLGKRAAGFISNILSVTNNNKLLAIAEPATILSAAAVAASLDLSIVPSIGEAHIVPYKDGKTGKVVAQFQMGWRGYVQLAQRTSMYKTIHADKVYEGQLKSHDLLTGTIELDGDGKKSDTVIGYFAYFELLNGFRKACYLSKDDAIKHGRRFSKSFDTGMWTKDVDAMGMKTCVKRLLDKWAPKSVDYQLQKAIETDQAVIKEDGTLDYIDNGEAIDAETLPPVPVDAKGQEIPFGN